MILFALKSVLYIGFEFL